MFEDNAKLPERSTAFSAGYDFFAIEDTYVPSLFTTESENSAKDVVEEIEMLYDEGILGYEDYLQRMQGAINNVLDYADNYHPVLVKTGIKAYMPDNEVLILTNRSSNPKRGLYLANGVGTIDKDYVDNEDNEGHIMFQFINLGQDDYMIEKGDKIGQGIFLEFKTVDDDNASGSRVGGFGSTGD